MRQLLLALTWLWLVPLCGGCSSSPAHDRADALPAVDATDANDASDAATDSPATETGPDTSSLDKVELDAPVACGSMTCAAGQICAHEKGGTDASPVQDHCYDLPGGCGGVPSCSCITSLTFICGMTCHPTGEREFVCNGA